MPLVNDRKGYRPRVLLFDVFETMLDMAPVKQQVARLLGGRDDLAAVWFQTQLQYAMVATLGDRFKDFGDIAVAALHMVAEANKLKVTGEDARKVVEQLKNLPPHPDVAEGLTELKKADFRMVTLTNSSRATVEQQLNHAHLAPYFEGSLGCDEVGYFKPHPHVYRWGVKRLGFKPGDAMLVAAHGWDVAGALWSGCRAAFVARKGQVIYPLADEPELVVPNFTELAKQLLALHSVDSFTE